MRDSIVSARLSDKTFEEFTDILFWQQTTPNAVIRAMIEKYVEVYRDLLRKEDDPWKNRFTKPPSQIPSRVIPPIALQSRERIEHL